MYDSVNHSMVYRLITPLTPKNDWHLSSPYTITPKSNIKVMTIIGNDHQLEKLLIVKQILRICTLPNVERAVWRIRILIMKFGCEELISQYVS